MVGISAYSAYLPLWRLSREAIAKGLAGEKAVANFDEDSITMAVAAALDCLKGGERQDIDGLFFASTTSPYKEKQASSIVAAAVDLRRDVLTADFANSLRAGTTALLSALDAIKAGSARKILVAAADCRLGAPGSDFERNCGDGAAAVLLSNSDVCVSVEASHWVSDEIIDVWRAEGDTFLRSWEDRFVQIEGYLKVVSEAVSALLQKCGLAPKDFAKVVYYAPDARRHAEMARHLGVDPKTQVQDPLFASVGNTGAAFPLMLLVAALEEAKAGDRILLASYGDGSDAFVLQVAAGVEKSRGQLGLRGHLASKKMVPDYQTYLQWRGLLSKEVARRPPLGNISPPALWRERDWNLRFHGAKCRACGTVQHPPQRVCTRCHAKDDFDEVRLSEKKGEVFTYSLDHLSGTLDTPQAIAVVNLEGGGRIVSPLTDREPEELKVGMPVEMSFRKLHSLAGIHNYFWKSIPARS